MNRDCFAGAALPSENQTRLLRACLLPRDKALAGWKELLNGLPRVSDTLRGQRAGFKRLLALLGYHLRRHGIEVDPPLAAHLRAARVREQLRAEGVRDLTKQTLDALAGAGVPAVALRGIAAAYMFYPDPALRHCHDLDLWMAPQHLAAAGTILEALSYTRILPRAWRHRSGFPVMIHHTFFRIGAFNQDLGDLNLNTVAAGIAGTEAAVLTPEASLLHLCGHAASTGSGVSPTWAADARLLLQRHPEIEWRRVVEWASRGTLALAMSVTLGYLAAELDAPIPREVLQALRESASRQPRQAAWYAALRSVEGRPLALLRSSRGLDRYRAFTYLACRATGLLEVS